MLVPVCIWARENPAEVAVPMNPAAFATCLDVPVKTRVKLLLATVMVAVVETSLLLGVGLTGRIRTTDVVLFIFDPSPEPT